MGVGWWWGGCKEVGWGEWVEILIGSGMGEVNKSCACSMT